MGCEESEMAGNGGMRWAVGIFVLIFLGLMGGVVTMGIGHERRLSAVEASVPFQKEQLDRIERQLGERLDSIDAELREWRKLVAKALADKE